MQAPFDALSPAYAPPPSLAPRRLFPYECNNELIIRQQPNRARMCGFGSKDYRPIDPAPILQLVRRDEHGRAVVDYQKATTLVCHASLWSADGSEERSVVINPAGLPKRLEARPLQEAQIFSTQPPVEGYVATLCGNLVSPCYVFTDLDGQKTLFFAFPALSVRTSGQYSLRFSLFDIGQDSSHAIAFVLSNLIEVYPPKTFPGMTESSALSKCLARQGVKLHIRTEIRRTSGQVAEEQDDEEEAEPEAYEEP
ncbi:hypothetical protein HDU87_001016 [Geranomyces variabilis]|uniref:Velvet domain-containing protein n=1 Tax=Geranomyces variabilis TaxID=109894 RepID=A0AAD5XP13_9FUNG|nr:hypothetical protein HDU87_001016 [Geranomyces variabilis]